MLENLTDETCAYEEHVVLAQKNDGSKKVSAPHQECGSDLARMEPIPVNVFRVSQIQENVNQFVCPLVRILAHAIEGRSERRHD
jgi:hypothetical protein